MKASDFLADDPWELEPALNVPDLAREIVDSPSGPRQAGADAVDGAQIAEWRRLAETSLYFLARGVLGCWWLTPGLHRPICDWLQAVPPRRKMLMIPRGHGKTTIVGQVLPIHLWVQPADANIYLPGIDGPSTRILMCGEKEERAKDHLGVVKDHLMKNQVLRSLWPHLVWERPKRDAPKWNDSEIIIPRKSEYPDPSMRAVGVGGAITGAHPNVLIKDDLTTEEAANSAVVMQKAVDWHINSRALLSNPLTDIEFITCTRWAVADLPDYIMTKDPTVEVNKEWRAIVDDTGRVIYPENYGAEGAIADLQAQFGVRFPLLYMNRVDDASLVDFSIADLRYYERAGGELVFSDDDRDVRMADALNMPAPRATHRFPMRLNDETTREMLRGKYLRRDHAS